MRNFVYVFSGSLWIALFLMFFPMPLLASWFRPAWVLLVLIYFGIFFPARVNMGTACMLGLVVDLLSGTLFGEHALAYTVILYWVNAMHLRFRLYTLLQQGFFVFLCVLFYLFILYCIQGMTGELPSSSWYWMSAVTSVIVWPWLFVLLRDGCQRFRVN